MTTRLDPPARVETSANKSLLFTTGIALGWIAATSSSPWMGTWAGLLLGTLIGVTALAGSALSSILSRRAALTDDPRPAVLRSFGEVAATSLQQITAGAACVVLLGLASGAAAGRFVKDWYVLEYQAVRVDTTYKALLDSTSRRQLLIRLATAELDQGELAEGVPQAPAPPARDSTRPPTGGGVGGSNIPARSP